VIVGGDLEKRLKSLLKEKCNQLNIEIISLETIQDHVHIFVRSQPTIAPNRIAAILKGYTKILRQEFSEVKSKPPTLWTRTYFVSTHDHVSTDTVEKYIEEQQQTTR
jgi:putative transposase